MCEVSGQVWRQQVLRVIKVFLPLPVVPAQALIQGGKPVSDLVLGTDGRHWIDGGGDPQAVARGRRERDSVRGAEGTGGAPSSGVILCNFLFFMLFFRQVKLKTAKVFWIHTYFSIIQF